MSFLQGLFGRPGAPPNIEKLKARRNVKGLIKALCYDKDRFEDGFVRARAAEALSEIGKPSVKPLIAALKDSRDFVRQRAAEALGEIGDSRAVEPLTAALKDKENFVRLAADEALQKIRDRSGKPSQERSDSSLSGSRIGEERKCGSCGRTFVDRPLEIEDLGIVGMRKRFKCPFCQTTMNYYDRP